MNFFTKTPTAYTFNWFTTAHWTLIIISLFCAVGIAMIPISSKKQYYLKKLLTIGLLLQVVTLYSWYIFTQYSGLTQSLPLYGCRIATLSFVLGIFSSKPIFKLIGTFLGLYGSILALLLPNLDPFTPPHLTTITYIVGHVLLLCMSCYYLKYEIELFTRKNIRKAIIWINIMFCMVWLIDVLTQTNYSYFNESPIFPERFTHIPPFIYGLIVLLVNNLFLFLTHLGVRKIQTKEKKGTLLAYKR